MSNKTQEALVILGITFAQKKNSKGENVPSVIIHTKPSKSNPPRILTPAILAVMNPDGTVLTPAISEVREKESRFNVFESIFEGMCRSLGLNKHAVAFNAKGGVFTFNTESYKAGDVWIGKAGASGTHAKDGFNVLNQTILLSDYTQSKLADLALSSAFATPVAKLATAIPVQSTVDSEVEI